MLLGQLSDIDVRLLRVFRQIVESGGLSAAELKLNISRSVISRHLKDLEIRLGGLHLCRRGRAGFSLTDEGRHVYNSILRLQGAMDSFRSEVQELHQQITGNLVIALGDLSITNPDANISLALRQFHIEAPEVTLQMHVQSLNAIEPLMMDGTYQIAIVPLHRRSSCLNYFPLFSEDMYLYCGPEHPLYAAENTDLSWEDLQEFSYAGLGYHSANMELSENAKLKRDAISNDQESIATLILSGCYIGFLPDHYAQDFVEKGLMRRIVGEQFTYNVEYSAIVRRAPRPSRIVKLMMKCLQEAHGVVGVRQARTVRKNATA
jgi:DNA-binding transcriptional LysR family regulator